MMKNTFRIILISVFVLFIVTYVLTNRLTSMRKKQESETINWKTLSEEEWDRMKQDFIESSPCEFYFPENIPEKYTLFHAENRKNTTNNTEVTEYYFQHLYQEKHLASLRAENIKSEVLWFIQSNDAEYNKKQSIINDSQNYQTEVYYFQEGDLENTLFWTKDSWTFFLRGNLDQETMERIANSVKKQNLG